RAFTVYRTYAAANQPHVRAKSRCVQTALHKIGVDQLIVQQQQKVIAVSLAQAKIKIVVGHDIRRLAKVPQTRIAIMLDQRRRGIRRAVVGYDDFDIAVRLMQCALEARCEKRRRAVIGRNRDSDERTTGVGARYHKLLLRVLALRYGTSITGGPQKRRHIRARMGLLFGHRFDTAEQCAIVVEEAFVPKEKAERPP